MHVWDSRTGKNIFSVRPGDPPYKAVPLEIPNWAYFTPDGKWIVGDRPYRIWHAETGAVRDMFMWRAWFTDEEKAKNAPLIPEAIAMACKAKSLREFGKRLNILICNVGLSENAKYMLTAIQDSQEKQIWDVSSGNLVSRITIPQNLDDMLPAIFSPDGSRFCIFQDSDKSVGVWDTLSGKQIATLTGLPVPYIHAEFSADNQHLLAHYYQDLHPEKWLYSGFEHDDETRVVHAWDIGSAKTLCTIKGINVGNAFPGNFSPDGARIWTSRTVYDVSNGKPVLESPDSETFNSFSPDSRSMVSSYGKGDVHYARIWRRRRPEYWWGFAWLPEFWLTVLLTGAFVWSVRRDWRQWRR
jgi:WD40 repeat protein